MRSPGNSGTLRVEVDGREASGEQLRFQAAGYGHFTAMQVRGGSVRGLDLHLERLDAGNRELFGAGLDVDLVRGYIRHALGTTADASVRTYAYSPGVDEVSIIVTVREPAEMPRGPLSLRSVPYQRPVPHTKHIGDFGQSYYGRLAERTGFHDALLTGANGIVSECAVANIAFFDGASIVWPDAPALQGITMQLLETRLGDAGLPTRRGPVRLADLSAFSAAFVTNARGIAAVGRVDDLDVPVDERLMQTLTEVYAAVPPDPI